MVNFSSVVPIVPNSQDAVQQGENSQASENGIALPDFNTAQSLESKPVKQATRREIVQRLISALDRVPADIPLTPVIEKRPYRKGWQSEEPIDRGVLKHFIRNGDQQFSEEKQKFWTARPNGYGLRFGGEFLGLDVDGFTAEAILQEVSDRVIPKTVEWKSGKPGRRALVYRISKQLQTKLAEIKFTHWVIYETESVSRNGDEQLDFRYERCQSVLPPSVHPTTGQYLWVNSFDDCEIADAPQWLEDLLLKHCEDKIESAKEQERKNEIRRIEREQRKLENQDSDHLDFESREGALTLLTAINPDDLDWGEWMRIVLAAHDADLSESDVYSWSSSSRKHTDRGFYQVWNHIKGASGDRYTVGTLWHFATLQGWRPPQKPNSVLEFGKPDPDLYAAHVAGEKEEERVIKAQSLEHYRENKEYYDSKHYQRLWRLSYKVDLLLCQPKLGALPFPESGLACVKSPKGSGKTFSVSQLVLLVRSLDPNRKIVNLTHRIQLGVAISAAIGIPWVGDRGSVNRALGFGLCVDSLHPKSQARFNFLDWDGAVLIIDECEQVFTHLLNSSTCKQDRIAIINTLRGLLRHIVNTGGLIILQDADLSDVSINFVRGLIGKDAPKPWVCVNEWKDSETLWKGFMVDSAAGLVSILEAKLSEGKRAFVCVDGQRLSSNWSTQNLERYLKDKFPEKKILRIDSESVSDPTHEAYLCAEILNELLALYDVVIASPTIGTGASIDIRGHFHFVFGLFNGALPESDARQFLDRVREPVDRYIYAREIGLGKIGTGSTFPNEIIKMKQKEVGANLRLIHEANATLKTLREADCSDTIDIEDLDARIDPVCLRTWAILAARVNAGMGRFCDCITESMIREGHRITQAEVDQEESGIEEIKEKIKDIRIENTIERAVEVETAKVLTEDEYKVLKAKQAKTSTERAEERKHELGKRYGIEVTAELHRKDDEESFYSKIRLHYLLINHAEKVAEQNDRAQIKEVLETGDGKSLMLQDLSNRTVKVRALIDLHVLSLIDPSRGEIRATDEDVQAFVEAARSNPKKWKAILNLNFSDKLLEKPLQAVRLVLTKIGFEMTSSRVGSGKGRQYVYTIQQPIDERWEVFASWDKKRKTVSSSDTIAPDPQYIINTNTLKVGSNPELSDDDLKDIRQLWEMAKSTVERNELKKIFGVKAVKAALSVA